MITEEREEMNGQDQAKYKLIVIKNDQKKIRELKIKRRIYPLLHRNYWNYEELNIDMKRHGKYAKIEIYFLRMNWNGSGYFPVCDTKLKISDEFFNIDLNKENVKDIVLGLLKTLKNYLENSDCEYVLRYFPE